MKKKILSLTFFILFVILFLKISNPKYIEYQASVKGKIIDENGKNISNAIIYRLYEKVGIHPKYGNEIRTLQILDSTYSDKNGNFIFKSKSKIFFTWGFTFAKKCELKLKATKKGYKNYLSTKNEWLIEDDFELCRNQDFKPIITLKK